MVELFKIDEGINRIESNLIKLESHDELNEISDVLLIEGINVLKNSILQVGIASFTSTITSNVSKFTENEIDQISILIKKWPQTFEVENTDEEIYASFLSDLIYFSEKYPNFFTSGTLVDFYKDKIWNPLLAPRYNRSMKLAKRFEYLLARKKSKYQVYCDTDFVSLDPYEFETLIGTLFERKGYKVTITPRTGDYGVDVIAKNSFETIAIQAKKYCQNNRISNVDVQKLLGGMNYQDYQADRSILVTTSDFTKMALEQAKGNPIELWNNVKLKSEIVTFLVKI